MKIRSLSTFNHLYNRSAHKEVFIFYDVNSITSIHNRDKFDYERVVKEMYKMVLSLYN